MNKTKIPLIFSIVGALGVIATGALSTLATIKAVKLLEGDDKQIKDISFNKETIKTTWKNYILPGSVAIGSIASIFIANGVNKKMLITLAGALVPITESYRKYKGEVILNDPELDKKISEEMGKDHYISPWGDDMGEKVIFYDPISDRAFERSWYEVKDAMYHFNRNFILRGYGYLNEFYDFLGLDRIDDGDIFGYYQDWFYDGGLLPWIDIYFEEETLNGKTYNNLVYTWPAVDLSSLEEDYPTINDNSYFISQT